MTALPEDVNARVDELYCLPLERFVPERDALARSLRADKRREAAAAVAKLAKPSVAAWAVNQVVRSQPNAARALWEAGDAVLAVQRRAVAGEAAGDELRAAIAAQRAALAPLADAARGLLTGRGAFLGEQPVQAVIETLHAAAVDADARPDVAAGRLARPLRLAGLGALPGAAPPAERRAGEEGAERGGAEAARRGGAQRGAGGTEAAKRDDAAERRRAAEEAKRRAAEQRARAAAERAVAQARRARDVAAERVARRREELQAAEAELARLEDELRAAEDALGDAPAP